MSRAHSSQQNLHVKISLLSLFAAAALSLSVANAAAEKSLFIDVHEFGPGKVNAAAVAEAHRADLAVQGKHDARFIDYWVDEEHGVVYCLSEAKDAASVTATHREAHGLLPTRILPVVSGQAAPAKGSDPLFLDVHQLGAGNVTPEAVAQAHEKDLAEQSKHGVRFLNYWVDEVSGTVLCLSQASNADAVVETHRQAHGLLPSKIAKVEPGK